MVRSFLIFPDLYLFLPWESVLAGAQGTAHRFKLSNAQEFRAMKSQPSSFALSHLCSFVPTRAHFSTAMVRPAISSRLMAQEHGV